MTLFLQSLGFGLAVLLMLLGVIGVIVPLVPGTLLVWMTVLVYAWLEGFAAIDGVTFAVISVLAIVTGTADLWMPLLGARASGASWQSMLGGTIGSLLGLIFFSLPGALAGYAVGLILGEYLRIRDWQLAFRASLGGLAGFGLSTLVQLGGAILILLVFVWQVLTY